MNPNEISDETVIIKCKNKLKILNKLCKKKWNMKFKMRNNKKSFIKRKWEKKLIVKTFTYLVPCNYKWLWLKNQDENLPKGC